jgi:hypothetical protein
LEKNFASHRGLVSRIYKKYINICNSIITKTTEFSKWAKDQISISPRRYISGEQAYKRPQHH